MAIQPSNYFGGQDPYAGAGRVVEDAFASGASALFGDPRLAGQRGLRTAQARVAGTQADLNEQAIEKNRRGLDAQGVIGQAFQDALTFKNPDGSTRAATQAEVMPRLGSLFQNLAFATGTNPQDIGNLFRTFTGMTGDERLSRSGYVAAGGAPGENYAATTGRADEVQARNAKSDKDRATAVAGIGASAQRYASDRALEGTRYSVDGNNAGALFRQQDAQRFGVANPGPLIVAPNTDVVLPPNDPRRPNDAPPGPATVSGQRTRGLDDTRARATQEWIDAAPTPEEKQSRQRQIAAGSVVNAETRAAAGTAQAEIRSGAVVKVAELAKDGKIAQADAAAWSKVEAAKIRGDSNVTAAETAAAARVEAQLAANAGTLAVAETGAAARVRSAEVGAQGRVDAAAAAAGGRRPPTVAKAVDDELTQEVALLESEGASSLTAEARTAIKQRAAELFQTQGGASHNNTTLATKEAYQEFLRGNPPDQSWFGGLFGKQLGVPKGAPPPRAPQPPISAPPGAIDALRRNPALAPQFDQKYGPGSAERALRGA